MLFNSYIFILLFLPISLVGYFTINRAGKFQLAKAFLIAMSFVFYAYFNISYLPIILFSILFNYLLNVFLHKDVSHSIRLALLMLGLVANLGVLVYFKYYDFFLENINAVFQTDFALHHLVLPLGISFFTFQQLSYVIDSYRHEVPNYNILDYTLFVTFFPQLIAGPIVLHSEIVPQFADKSKKCFNAENFSKGIFAFALGLAKKVILADLFGIVVSYGYDNIAGLSSVDAAIVMLAFTFQIYFDFSGYCDMAIGLGYMFNINIPQNFNSPYKALNVDDFWKRWHMTLTRFFRKYVYIPLGGNRKGEMRTYINITVVFILSGLWHGANWTFLVWGGLHGIAIVFSKLFAAQLQKIPRMVNLFATFLFVNITWVYFRALSIADAHQFLGRLFSFDFSFNKNVFVSFFRTTAIERAMMFLPPGIPGFGNTLLVVWFGIALYFSMFAKNTFQRITAFRATPIQMAVTVALLFWSIISLSGVSTFLYYNF